MDPEREDTKEGMNVKSENEVICKRSFQVVVKLIEKVAIRQQSFLDCSCCMVACFAWQDLPCFNRRLRKERVSKF